MRKALTEKGYRQKIIANCKGVGTYREEFDFIIDRLAELYVRYDNACAEYEKSGDGFVIEQVNKNGSTYTIKNPYLSEVDHVSDMILELERELGLTPAALRKINESAMKSPAEDNDPLSSALRSLRVIEPIPIKAQGDVLKD